MPGLHSLYATLNVSPDAEWVVIEAAHKALMKKYHPDRGADAANVRRAAMVNEAFSILKDPKKRADYEARNLPPEPVRQMPSERAFMAAGARPSASLKMVAWSGWLSAIAVGVALAVTVRTQEDRHSYARYHEPEVEEPQKRSPHSASTDLLGLGGTAAVAAPVVGTAMMPANLERPPSFQAAPQKRLGKPRKQRKAARRPVRTRAGGSGDREFLEREGYIY